MPKQGSKTGKLGKSSKTARVLNLLTDPDLIESSSESEAPLSASDGARLSDDRRTQANIRGALEMELSEVAAAPARPKRSKGAKSSAPTAPVAPSRAVRDSEPEPPREDEDAGAAPSIEAADWPSAPEPVFPVAGMTASSPLENTINELRAADETQPDEFICFNVMQALVEDKTDKYIKMFGLCNCNRCRIDVIALALSNLPSKYVVAQPHELIPRLSMYEQKYSASVVTQVMSACRKVLDRPHHQRTQG